jgi:hypothetical protein
MLQLKHPQIILIILALFLAASPVLASEPTQQFNKLYMTPFYRESMTHDVTYNYSINVNPPDKISSVLNAIVSFNAQINGQSQLFILLVNNQSCNTVNYTVATAFSTTGNIQFFFDCSNVITASGNYSITLKSTVNTGAITGWIDLTYMNAPMGTMNVFGTEYVSGESSTIFLQFKNSNNFPINNKDCYFSLYNSTVGHNLIYNNTRMSFLSNGLYYYDLAAPSLEGVYMISAHCVQTNILPFLNYISYNTTTSLLQYSYIWYPPELGYPLIWKDEDYLSVDATKLGGTGTPYAVFYPMAWTIPANNFYPSEQGLNGIDFEILVYGTSGLEWIRVGVWNYCKPGCGASGYTNATLRSLEYCYNMIYSAYNQLGLFPAGCTDPALKTGGTTNSDDCAYSEIVYLPNNVFKNPNNNSTNLSCYFRENYLNETYAYTLMNTFINLTSDNSKTDFQAYIDYMMFSSVINKSEIPLLYGSGEIHVSGALKNQIAGLNSSINNLGSTYIGGTEYISNQSGLIAVRLISASNAIVTGAVCNVSIFYPNRSIWLNMTPMTELDSGIYYYNFSIPNTTGVYIYSIDCTKTGQNYRAMNTFHVSSVSVATNDNLQQNITDILTYLKNLNITVTDTYILTSTINSSLIVLNLTVTNGFDMLDANHSQIISLIENDVLDELADIWDLVDYYGVLTNKSLVSINSTLYNMSNSLTIRINYWGILINTTQISILNAVNNVNDTQIVWFEYINNSLQNISITLDNLNFNFSFSSNESINLSCPPINYSYINETCAGFFSKNGGESMWVALILILFCIVMAEVARTHYFRAAAALGWLLFVWYYWAESWFLVLVVVASFYMMYACIKMFMRPEEWSIGGR